MGSFSVTVLPENAEDKSYTITSSDENVVSVNQDGSFSCIAHGTATISVTASNGVTSTRDITVYDMHILAAEVVRLTNTERTNNGLYSLSGNSTNLNTAAMIRANELIQLYSHDRPDGRGTFTVFDETGVTWQKRAGENCAEGQRTPQTVVESWMNSPGHKSNILNTDFAYIGVGVAMNNNGRLYWVQLFHG